MVVLSKIKVNKNDENGVRVSQRRTTSDINHWAFLDEIEAPMWVDLSIESKLIMEDNDDAWFHTSHPFHYHSACRLRSKFAHLDVGSDPFNFNLRGQFSPPLLSSVSKSRGKDYRIRDSRSNHHNFSSNKEHPINELGHKISSYKSQVNDDNKSELSSCVTIVDGRERSATLNFQSASTIGLSSSTITSVNWQCDSNVSGMPKDTFGHTGNLLNCLKTNLRKSRASRRALRVEINDKESKGHKSSKGKSSVGSSSIGNDTKIKGFSILSKVNHSKNKKVEMNGNIKSKDPKTSSMRSRISNPKFEVKKIGGHLKEVNCKKMDIGNFGKITKPINGRVKGMKTSETRVSVKNAPSCGQEASKGKVLLPIGQKNSLIGPRSVQSVTGKVGINQLSIKENIKGRAVLNTKVGGKENLLAAKLSDHKPHKLKSKDKVKGTSTGSKMNTNGKSSQDTRIYLR